MKKSLGKRESVLKPAAIPPHGHGGVVGSRSRLKESRPRWSAGGVDD